MFAAKINPYDDPVAKATDEAQTSENWDVLFTVWEKVNEDGEQGARNCVAALTKRLNHRNANVLLYSLTLADALVKNCGKPLHHEIASKTFTDTLKRMIADRNTHEKVKKRIAQLVKEWTNDFERDESLGIMAETYEYLQNKGIRFDEPADEGPKPISDDVLKREEEDLQRAIAESEREAKSRPAYASNYNYQPSVGSSSSNTGTSSGYVPASQKPLPAVEPPSNIVSYPSHAQPAASTSAPPSRQSTQPAAAAPPPATAHPSKCRALYDFDPDADQPGELPLKKGDVIRIIDSAYQEWWRGELHGRVGIFPVTYVEVIPDPTPDMMLAEAQYEANVFSQAGEIDRLLLMLQSIDPNNPNMDDNEELSALYSQCLSLRPKILKLVSKYTDKKNELLEINTRFMTAKTEYETILDESWRRHQGQQDAYAGYAQQQPAYAPQQPQYAQNPSQQPPQQQGPPQHYAPHEQQQQPQQQQYAPLQQPTAYHQGQPTQQGQPPPSNEPGAPYFDQASGQWFYPPNDPHVAPYDQQQGYAPPSNEQYAQHSPAPEHGQQPYAPQHYGAPASSAAPPLSNPQAAYPAHPSSPAPGAPTAQFQQMHLAPEGEQGYARQ